MGKEDNGEAVYKRVDEAFAKRSQVMSELFVQVQTFRLE
jgi:hypothetical protein